MKPKTKNINMGKQVYGQAYVILKPPVLIYMLGDIGVEFRRSRLYKYVFTHVYSCSTILHTAPRLTPTPISQEGTDSRDEQAGEADSLDPTAEPLKYFEALPDNPLQLIRPDPAHHRKLEIVARNVKHLHYIDTAVAVVAVVGKFHSGKSFLLNQMMGKSEGFGIGPSVRPQTMGIWMWGKVSTPTHILRECLV